MILKTEAIVLGQMKWRETSVIVKFYTKNQGLKTGVAKGVRSPRTKGNKGAALQVFTHVELVYYDKDSRDMQLIKSADVITPFWGLKEEMERTAYGLAVVEIFEQCVREEEQNEKLFGFLLNILKYFDTAEQDKVQTFIWFMIRLCALLGFEPDHSRQLKNPKFEIEEGKFIEGFGKEGDELLYQIANVSNFNFTGIMHTKESRTAAINTMFAYLKQHVVGFQRPKSLKVFSQILY